MHSPSHYTDPYSLENIGFGQISGAQGGGQNLSDLITALSGTLQKGGYFGTDYEAPGEQVGLGQMGRAKGLFTDPSAWREGQYSLGGIEKSMGQFWGEGMDFSAEGDEEQQGMQSLLKLLQSLDIPGMQKEYGQNVGDVQSEIGSQMQGLIQGRATGSKAGRYGGIGSGGRNIAGGRDKYMSDYYGLQEKQFSMEQNLQKQLEEDLYSGVGQFMQLNPAG
tara:strand:- start:53 stop:712 length:660 start_codon:yes stop_codon:yes gene_type:complete